MPESFPIPDSCKAVSEINNWYQFVKERLLQIEGQERGDANCFLILAKLHFHPSFFPGKKNVAMQERRPENTYQSNHFPQGWHPANVRN